MNLFLAIGVATGLFCILRGAVDLWQKRYVWGVLGIAVGLAILATPFQTHAVKYDLPAPSQR